MLPVAAAALSLIILAVSAIINIIAQWMEPANEHQVRSMSWGERIRSAGYNIKYRALSYLEESAPTAIIRNF